MEHIILGSTLSISSLISAGSSPYQSGFKKKKKKKKNYVAINDLERRNVPLFMEGKRKESSQTEPLPTGQKAAASAWQAGGDLYLQSSKVVPGDANARRLRSSSLSLVTWRSWNRIVSRLSLAGRLSLMAGGGEDASPFTGEPATASTEAV